MSNFKRSRSKVWWGDSPPHIGSPVAQASDWNKNNQQDNDWEPQVPQWIGNPDPPAATVNNSAQMSPKEAPANPWPLRHGSPGSHKSQDSGFSDSDSSPPSSQYYPSPEIDGAKSMNKSSSSSDSNNNENVTVKQVIDFKDTPKSTKNLEVPELIATPKTAPRMRSTSVIQTPYDFEKYIEVHGDKEHLEKVINSSENISADLKENDIKITVTPPKNNTISVNKADRDLAKNLVPKKVESKSSPKIKVAKVKDLETSKTKSQDSLEYLQVSELDHIAVNNLPRMRSPISTVPYVPPPDYDLDSPPKRPTYSRSNSHQNKIIADEKETFQRNRLNKSLNHEARRLDQQILDIQEDYNHLNRSNDSSHSRKGSDARLDGCSSRFNVKKVTDSLQLKPHKKYGPKNKHKSTPKFKEETCTFRIFSSKKDKRSMTDNGGTLDSSRVPSLGLPKYTEKGDWIIVGHPDDETILPNERLISNETESNLHSKLRETKDLSKSAEIKKIPPPIQFQDRKLETSKSLDQLADGNINLNFKTDKQKVSTESFCMNFNMECTSTPKMLAPQEYMYNMLVTPQLPPKNSRLRRVNLLENFNESQSNKSSPEYQERSIDETPLERIANGKPDSVQYWLCDLIGSCENECMTTLQSKALGLEVKALVSSSSATITGNIKKVQTHGQIIVHQYSEVLFQLDQQSVNEEAVCLLVANVNEFVLTHSITLNTRPPAETPERWQKVRAQLQTYLHRLVEIGEDIKTELNDSGADCGVLAKHLHSMLHIFEETIKAVLIQQLKTLVSIIEEPPSDLILKSSLTSISHLAAVTVSEVELHQRCQDLMKGVSVLPFVECAVPRALLTAVIETNKNSVKALSLRALATICTNREAVEQFEQAGGMEILADMLSDANLPEPAARETATVLVQTTATWRAGCDPTAMCSHLDTLVAGLTRILHQTECCQLLLLCTACLVNLVREVEQGGADRVDTAAILSTHRTAERVLEAVKRRGPEVSVFLQEQTAAFFATLTRSARGLRHASGVRACAVALVCFARASPGDFDGAPERESRARARLIQHAVEALSRLSMFPELSTQIVQLEGVPRLIRLVRMQRARQLPKMDSDNTLVYCLTTLRNINKHRPDAFVGQSREVREMVEGHLMQAVMKFSSKMESYV